MAYGDASEQIRTRAWEKYIKPEIQRGSRRIELPIKPLMKEMESEGFPPNHPRQFCKALQKKSFLQGKGLILDRIDGPPSGTSTTVVLHLRVAHAAQLTDAGPLADLHRQGAMRHEDPEARAKRVVDGLRGLLKNEIGSFGGTEAFMRWVRADEDEAA